jgi:hypothetical protein
MRLETSTINILIGICLQALALAALFIWAGAPLMRRSFPTDDNRPLPLSFVYGGGFFLGLTTFLILFVLLSHILHGARAGLWVTFALMAALPFVLRSPANTPRLGWRPHSRLIAVLLGLVAVQAVVAATCWLYSVPTGPSPPPSLMYHFGSIHSGRYASYGIYIAEFNRVPRIAQNMGQSILAAVHLMLHLNSPLSALTIWIAVSMAGFACLVFGFLRWNGLSFGWALSGAFFVLYCNIAVSLVSVFLLDNGSPLGFAGYTDLVVGAATFMLACGWFRTLLLDPERCRVEYLPFGMGVLWCWCAPQNIPVAGVAMGGAGLIWLWQRRSNYGPLLRRLAVVAAISIAAVAVGATQMGTFLPRSMREEIGATVFVPESGFRFRPYIQYYRTLWSGGRSNLSVPAARGTELERAAYEERFENLEPLRPAQRLNATIFLIETHFWGSCRIYGYLLLGVGLIAWRFRHAASGPDRDGLQAWFWMALGSLLVGYFIVFALELDEMKWWLTRFLVPAIVVCLTALVLAMAPQAGSRASWAKRTGWALLVLAATWGPLFEFGQQFRINWIVQGKADPASHRLNLLAKTKGPFPYKPAEPVKRAPVVPRPAPEPTATASPPPDRASTR